MNNASITVAVAIGSNGGMRATSCNEEKMATIRLRIADLTAFNSLCQYLFCGFSIYIKIEGFSNITQYLGYYKNNNML